MKLTIEEKLVGASVLSLVLVGGLITFWTNKGTHGLTQRIDSVYTDVVLPLRDVQQLRKSIHDLESNLLEAVSSERPADITLLPVVRKSEAALYSILEQYQQRDTIASEPVMKDLLMKVGALSELNHREQEELKLADTYVSSLRTGINSIEEKIKISDKVGARKYYDQDLKETFDYLERVPDVLMELQLQQANYANQEGVSYAAKLSTTVTTTILLSFVAVAIVTFYLSKRTITPLRDSMVKMMSCVANLSKVSKEFSIESEKNVSLSKSVVAKSSIILGSSIEQDPKSLDVVYALDDNSKEFKKISDQIDSVSDKISVASKHMCAVLGDVPE
jgi:hypothetical protein